MRSRKTYSGMLIDFVNLKANMAKCFAGRGQPDLTTGKSDRRR
jgi:hypothetical protein